MLSLFIDSLINSCRDSNEIIEYIYINLLDVYKRQVQVTTAVN